MYLGPTLRARPGDSVELRVHNKLPEATTIHWHGMHLPAVADGGPHQLIEPGETWAPSWTIEQPAATLWYNPQPGRHGLP
jgi:FtsP/CotA-like multicopper oxidase with cupredoxin domain